MTVCVYCLIPAKPYPESKSRLASILSSEQRVSLNRWLLVRTLRLAREVVGPVVVVSRDRSLLVDAEMHGAWGLPEEVPGLNPALTQAASFATAHGATGVLVLPTDLPRLAASDLEIILSLGGIGGAGINSAPHSESLVPAQNLTPTLVIVPSRHGTGTNALLLRPPDLIPFLFGPDSFSAHCAAGRAAGVEPIVHRTESIAFDLDTPKDWESGIWNHEIIDWGSEIEV